MNINGIDLDYKSIQGVHWAYETVIEKADNNPVHVEDRIYFNPDWLDIPDDLLPIFGHCDAWWLDDNGELHVADLKQGCPKSDHFHQMCGYAYGLMEKMFIGNVHLHVLYFTLKQRIYRNLSIDEVKSSLEDCLKNKLDPNATPTPNEWCQYCKHFLNCKEVKEKVAEYVFLDKVFVEPDNVSVENLHFLANLKTKLEDKCKEVIKDKHAVGEDVEGIKITEQTRKGKLKTQDAVKALINAGAQLTQILEAMEFSSRDRFTELYQAITNNEPPKDLFEDPTKTKVVRRDKKFSPINKYREELENN
jgi:hypothetical protein